MKRILFLLAVVSALHAGGSVKKKKRGRPDEDKSRALVRQESAPISMSGGGSARRVSATSISRSLPSRSSASPDSPRDYVLRLLQRRTIDASHSPKLPKLDKKQRRELLLVLAYGFERLEQGEAQREQRLTDLAGENQVLRQRLEALESSRSQVSNNSFSNDYAVRALEHRVDQLQIGLMVVSFYTFLQIIWILKGCVV